MDEQAQQMKTESVLTKQKEFCQNTFCIAKTLLCFGPKNSEKSLLT